MIKLTTPLKHVRSVHRIFAVNSFDLYKVSIGVFLSGKRNLITACTSHLAGFLIDILHISKHNEASFGTDKGRRCSLCLGEHYHSKLITFEKKNFTERQLNTIFTLWTCFVQQRKDEKYKIKTI